MTKFLALAIPGAVSGAIYAIMASGMVLTYQTSGIFNFAHGAVAFATAYLFFELDRGAGLPVALNAVISVLIFAPLLGLALDRMMLRRLATAPVYARVVGTIGLLVALPNLALFVVDQVNAHGGNLPTNDTVAGVQGLGPNPPTLWHVVNNVPIDSNQVAVFAAAAVAAVGLWFVLRRTRLGLEMRADVDRRDLATLRGVNPAQVSAVSWVFTMVLAGLGGVLLAPSIGLADISYTYLVLGSMAAVVAARLRSLPTAFLAGIGLGILQNMVAGYEFLPRFLLDRAGFRTAIPFILTVLGLLAILAMSTRRAQVARVVAVEAPQPDHRAGLPAWRRRLPWVVVNGTLVVWALVFADDFWASLAAKGVVFALIFLSFVVVTGVGGMVSLSQATFVTAGGFMTGYLVDRPFSWSVPLIVDHGRVNFAVAALVAAAVAAAAGALVALTVCRLGALELALATLALAFTAELVIFQIPSVSNGSVGYSIEPPSVGGLSFRSPRTLLILLLLLFGGLTWLVHNLMHSASGRAMYAARSSDVATRTIGHSPDRAKVMLFALSAAIAGLGGAFDLVIASPFNNTTNPALLGLLWLAGVVTWGVRRPGGALAAGLAFAMGQEIFGRITSWSDGVHDVVYHGRFLPILFGLAAINLAKNPDGILALSAAQRADKKRAKLQAREVRGAADPGVSAATDGAAVPSRGGPTTDAPAPRRDPVPSPTLLLDGIVAGYDDVRVLHGVDLAVAPGRIVALLGANGAGKSTLALVASGLLAPTTGRVWFQGREITDWAAWRRSREGILLAPEQRGIFPGLTVEENLMLRLRAPDEREQAYTDFPILGQRRQQMAGFLSGGEQQMLALASALVRPPALLIADEPSLGLAPLVAEEIWRTLVRLRDTGVAILLVEEKSTEALRFADDVALMSLGRIVWAGPRTEVDEERVAAAYLGAGQELTSSHPG
jgi:ABC-type branched-subunit amino acid transport system ATPase component/branched-subunit amino acid ABC-type transport system permease component